MAGRQKRQAAGEEPRQNVKWEGTYKVINQQVSARDENRAAANGVTTGRTAESNPVLNAKQPSCRQTASSGKRNRR